MNGDDDTDPAEDQIDEQPSQQQTVDAGSPRAVKKRQTKLQIQEREEERFWKGVFSDPIGRRCMWKLLDGAHPFEERFACGPNGFPQTEATWFHAGEQSLGLRIYQTWLARFPLEVMEMHKEHDSRFGKKGE